MNDITIIAEFITGKIETKQFENILYESESLKVLFSEQPAPSWSTDANLYFYLISQNYNSTSDLLNIQEALSQFLTNKGIEIEKSDDFQKILDEKYKILPKWLSITDEVYSTIRQGGNDLKGKEFNTYIKDQIQKKFICLNKPPHWLQDTFWPISNGIPLVFVGQLEISTMRHDKAYAYLFYNPSNQTYQTIEQVM